MTEPSALKTAEIPLPFTPPPFEILTRTAFAIISDLLKAYGFREDAPDGEGGEQDFRINVNREDFILALDIDANLPIRGILIGRRGSNVLALERILISALFRRLCPEKGQKLGRTIRLSVNGTRPDTKRENEDEEQPAVRRESLPAGKRPAVVVLTPPDVDVIIRPTDM